MLILEENNLEGFIEEDIPEPKGYKNKTKVISLQSITSNSDSTPSS